MRGPGNDQKSRRIAVSTVTLDQAIQDIEDDTVLTAAQKLSRQAQVLRDYRAIHGEAERIYGVKNKTSFGGTFGRSVARSFGSHLVKAIFRGLR